jgi:ABC-type multidrug transport system permease subunit
MNEEIFSYMFPGLMLMWVFFIAQNTLADLYEERDNKTLMRLMSTSASVNQIVLGKIIRCFLICFIVEILLVLVTMMLFGIKWGNPFWLTVVACSMNISITGTLALVYGLMKSKDGSNAVIVIVILFTAFMSGSFFPFENMPKFLQNIGEWVFNRWGIVGIRGVMNGSSLDKILPPVMKLFAYGIVTTFLGSWFLKRRMESGEAS